VDVLHHHLESIEAPGLWNLNFCHKSLGQVFKHNSVRSGKEGKDMLDEMLFVVGQLKPVLGVLGKINFLSRPEAGHLIFVHLPDVVVPDRKNDKSIWVFLKQRLRKWLLGLSKLSFTLLGHNTLAYWNLRIQATMLTVVLMYEL
jgi:hypothetical protein